MSALMIDNIIRRAEYAKFYNDLDASTLDFNMVVKICQEFPEGNKRVLGSAFFNLGKIMLEQDKREDAKAMFEKVQTTLRECLLELLKKNGQTEIDSNIQVAELIKPSIFDDANVQGLKDSLLDVQEYILECHQLDQIQPQLDQMKKEAQENAEKGVDTSVPDGFGLPQKDAGTFQTIKLKSRKRKIDEISVAQENQEKPVNVENKENQLDESNKRRKMEEPLGEIGQNDAK